MEYDFDYSFKLYKDSFSNDRRIISIEADDRLQKKGISLPRSLKYSEQVVKGISEAMKSNSSLKRNLKILKDFNGLNLFSLFKDFKQTKSAQKGLMERIIDIVTFEYVDELNIDMSGVTTTIGSSYLHDAILRIFGVRSGQSTRIFDLGNISRILRKDPGYLRSLDPAQLLPVLTRPDILLNVNTFSDCLRVFGINSDLSTELVEEISKHALLYALLESTAAGFSVVSDTLTIPDLSIQNLKRYISFNNTTDDITDRVLLFCGFFKLVASIHSSKHTFKTVRIVYEIRKLQSLVKRYR
jgi:hypothetical protein